MPLSARLGTIAALLCLTGGWVATPASAASWSKPSKVQGVKLLRAVSCVSRTFCMAVGGGQAVAYRFGVWLAPRTIDSHRGLNNGLVTVSCVPPTLCVAGDGAGTVFTYNRARWSSPTLMTTAGLSRLSCGAATFCGALDIIGRALFYNGLSWSSPQRMPGNGQPQSISCPSAGFCVAVDGDSSSAYRLSRGRWVHSGAVHTTNPQGGSEPNLASAISCSGRRFCAALDDFGEAFTWAAGSGWSRPHRFDGNLLDGSDAVSCRARTACMAVDEGGFMTRWNGSTWSRKRRIDPSRAGLIDVSCASARFCVAVGLNGRALIYR